MREPTYLAPSTRITEFRDALFGAGPSVAIEEEQVQTNRILVADGAMGSTLLARRAMVNRSLDELNLSLPALVRDVHQDFLRAGAQIIQTNTFGASRPRLAAFGFADKVRAINQAGVRIAREAARGQAFVAGTVGPLGVYLEPAGSLSPEAARVLFREQIEALLYAGVDLLMLETFQNLDELREAILAARESGGPEIVVIAQLSIEEDGALADGSTAAEFMRKLSEWPVDAIGLNCSTSPAMMLETIELMRRYTDKPLTAMPSAGLPSVVDGRAIYPLSTEYLARYAARFLRAGVKIVGGCCGVTPEHIQAIATEARAFVPDASIPPTAAAPEHSRTSATIEHPSTNLPSSLGAKLATNSFVTLLKIDSPRGGDASREIELARHAKALGFDAIHVSETRWGGPRLNPLIAAQFVQQQAGIEAIYEIGSHGQAPSAIQSDLITADALGIRNILCGLNASLGLLHQVRTISRGRSLVGVRANPESIDLEFIIRASPDFIVTQPVFDTAVLEEFLNRIRPLRVPVIVGIETLTSARDAEFMIHERQIPVPPELIARIAAAENPGSEGLTIAQEMAQRIRKIAAGVEWNAPRNKPWTPANVTEAIGPLT